MTDDEEEGGVDDDDDDDKEGDEIEDAKEEEAQGEVEEPSPVPSSLLAIDSIEFND